VKNLLEQLNQEIAEVHKSVLDSAESQLLGQDVILNYGKFKGRRARITLVNVIGNEVMFLAQPYRLDGQKVGPGDNPDLLWDHPQAREYRKARHVTFIDER